METKVKLTKRLIDNFKYGSRWDVRWDTEITGFGVRVYPSGKKSYIISYRIKGRKKLLVLGSTQILTLEQARNMAKINLAEVTKGNDPAKDKSDSKNIDFKAFCNLYLERHANHKKTSQEDKRKIEKYFIPNWGNLSLSSITKEDIIQLHCKIGESAPYEANRMVNLLSTIFELAKKWEYLDENYPNPTKYIKLYKEIKRDRWVNEEEMSVLIKSIDQESNLYASKAIWLYLLTGVRKSELLKTKWKDINLQRKELRLEDTKAGRIHYVPLSQAAIDVINSIPRLPDNPYLLPGHINGKHLVNISKPWNRIRKNANLEDVRLHDLRRTVGSWLAQSGNSLHLIGRVLNHSNQSTTAGYAYFDRANVENALESHGKKLMSLKE